MNKRNTVVSVAVLCIIICIAACSQPAYEKPAESFEITDSKSPSSYSTTSESETEAVVSEQPDDLTVDDIDNTNPIVITAEALIGLPFAENGESPEEGFDNSGFIYYVLRENGFINCPRQTPAQSEMGRKIGFSELKSGDLAFFSSDDSGNADFGGIYIGNGIMIYSPMPGQCVKEVDITTDYWVNTFATGISLS